MNHRFLLRLITNLAVFLLTLSCFGIVLWVIDEILRWDILPDVVSLVLQALLVAGGIITFVIVVMNVLLSLALNAEANASQAQLPDYSVSRELRRKINRGVIAGIVAIALLLGGLQITNQIRARVAARENLADFNQAQVELNQSTPEVLSLFTPPILEGLETNTLPEKGQLGNTSKLFEAIRNSFPQSPNAVILTRANQAPYQYAQISADSIRANSAGKTTLYPEFYTTFPEPRETEAIEQLFAGELPSIPEPLTGKVIKNTEPSSWGVLERNGRAIAIVYLRSGAGNQFDPYSPYPVGVASAYYQGSKFHHDGPDQLFTN